MGSSVTPLSFDAQGNPLEQKVAPQPTSFDAEGNPIASQPSRTNLDPKQATDAWRGAVYGKMLDVSPGYAYQNADEIDKQMREQGGDDFDLIHSAEAGFDETPLGMLIRGQAPEPFESHNLLNQVVHDVVGMATDPVILIPTLAATLVGAPELGFIAGSFLDGALREGLMDHYQKGDVKSFGELADRASDILWAGTKGGLTAEAFGMAGELSPVLKSPLASAAMKGLFESSAMTVAGSLLDGRIPNANDFIRSAAVMVPLGLVSGGKILKKGEAEQAFRDVYAETGTNPDESAVKLSAQPPVPPDPAPGLRPAIKTGEGFVEGEQGDVHDDIAKRTMGEAPVSNDALEADPTLADKVLQNPEIYHQSTIDRAWELKRAELEAGGGEEPIDLFYDRGAMKSGRGFVTPDGKFLTREQAHAWVKENEPEVSEMWEKVDTSDGNRDGLIDAAEYHQARTRVHNRTLAEGEPAMTASPANMRTLAAAREDLNRIKAGEVSTGYGKSVLRTLFVGQRDMRIAITSQLREGLKKLIPDFHDQEALTFLRDYRDNPEALRGEIESIRNGDNEELKKLIPSLERALNPSPELLQADRQMTAYYTSALTEGRDFRFMDSSVPPDRYSPRLFMKMLEDGEKQQGVGRPTMTTKTPHSIQRVHEYILDALKTGSVEARTLNALDALTIYGERHAKAVATNLLKQELQNTELGKQGSRDEVPEGWRELAPNARTLRDFYVPKDVYEAMKPILRTESLLDYPIFKGLRHAQSFVKAIELGFSVFHMKALSITAMNNMKYADFVKSLKSDISSPEFESAERDWASRGLTTTMTSTPYEAYKGLKPSSLPTRMDVIKGTFPVKQLDAVFKGLTHETFDVIQRKFKVMDASLKEAAWAAKHPEATDTEYGAAMRSIAKEVNGAYGGLNWEVMGWGKDARELARAFILAPDWTFSNVVNLKYTTEGGPGGAAARMFWVKSFATGLTLTQAASIAISGKTSDKPFDVYLGTDKNGKKMYTNMFFAGAPKDALTWLNRVQKDGAITGTAEFFSYKLGPIAGTGLGLIVNKDFSGKPITKRGQGFVEKTAREAGYAAGQMVPAPFSAKELAKMIFDPDKEASYWDVIGALTAQRVTHDKGDTQSAGKAKGYHLPGVTGRTSRLPGVRR